MALFPFTNSSSASELKLGVYIWSSCFEKLDISKVDNFIESRNIQRVELSYKAYLERESVRRWTRGLVSRGKEVDIILSEPTYIFPEKWGELRKKLIDIFDLGFNIHFDIEPHILPDFKEKKHKYLKLFVILLKKTHLIADKYQRRLSVAISVSHYKSAIKEIFDNSDLVVFMVYGFKNTKRINRIVASYKTDKTALALRGKDFTNEKELLDYIHNINRLTGISIFIIQNLRQWEELK